ncbi:MAG: hypothetical protein M1371_10245 [Actinobacteria bacterium]|nr:hypothetical protein [Actinomycetota bacterium]MCL5986922.1 hypothetical protein [Actinomycetota bacterium]
MYIAELKGKLSSKVENYEDILTSNVFSFFKYSDRKIFLKALLERLNISVNNDELQNAEFIFWPSFGDKTEPDLILIIGKYYLLFEVKYYSNFGKGSSESEDQLKREIKGGLGEATNLGKEFVLIAVTADYYYRESKFKDIPPKYRQFLKWLNWQTICEVIMSLLDKCGNRLPDLLFAQDLYSLFEKKNLRCFQTFNRLADYDLKEAKENIFFSFYTANYRGDFVGFSNVLSKINKIMKFGNSIFYSRIYFNNLSCDKFVPLSKIFFERTQNE